MFSTRLCGATAVALCLALASPGVAAESFFSEDKATHAAVSYGFSLTGTLILRKLEVPRWLAVTISAATTLAIATVWEFTESENYSWHDQAANSAGVAASSGFVFAFQF